jgi:dihydroorotase
MSTLLLKNGRIVTDGKSTYGDVLIKDGIIQTVGGIIDSPADEVIDCTDRIIMPGIIDDQVHFREPGLTHKANIGSESRAALVGGTTTFMEMPNTKPPAITQERLQDKYDVAAETSYANYSFFMGASNDNLEEVLKTDKANVCGVKIFMGSSTGNMLVDNERALEGLFGQVDMLIATHCEDESTIRGNMQQFVDKYGDDLIPAHHPLIRNVEGCLLSSQQAISLAKRHDTRLHILHISTAEETALFRNDIPLSQKRITSEACVHHLTFTADDYATLGNQIKCNPAIKAPSHKEAIWTALLDDRIDIIATDHAPHTWEEKSQPYAKAPSGLPLVQHSLYMMLQHVEEGRLSLERMVEKMCHTPAICFDIHKRGYLREGYFGDIVIVDTKSQHTVEKSTILYKCGWSPLEGRTFNHLVTHTILNGAVAYDQSKGIVKQGLGQRITFDRD